MNRNALLFYCLFFSLTVMAVPDLNANREPIAMIVNKNNKISNVTSKELARLYSGRQKKWVQGKKVVIINRPIESEIRRLFYKNILRAKPTKKFFKSKSALRFKTMKLKSGLATRKFVARIPEAIGYVYLSEVDDTVKVLSIDGLLPSKKGYKLN